MADLALIEAKESVKETAKSAQAFADYVALGPNRSLRGLAEQYAQQGAYKTATTAFRIIGAWSTDHQWQERLKELSQRQVAESFALRSSLYLDILREYYRRFGDDPTMIRVAKLDALHGVFDRVKPADALHIIGELTTAIRLIGVDPESI